MKVIVHIPVEITLSANIPDDLIARTNVEKAIQLWKYGIEDMIRDEFDDIDQIICKPKVFILEE